VTVPLAAEAALKVQVDARAVPLRFNVEQLVVIPEGEITARATVPVKPLTGDMVTVEDPVLPAVKLTEVGLAASPKSGMIEVVPKNSLIGVLPQSLTKQERPQLFNRVEVRL
jgi:hypothetical protein